MWPLILAFALSTFSVRAEEFRFVLRGSDTDHDITARATVERLPLGRERRAELLRFPQPWRELLSHVQNEHGRIVCDCGTFVQIQARLERKDDGMAVLLTPEGNPAGAIACACERDLAYLRPDNLLAFQILQNSSFSAKGHWLLPLGDNRYLGILREGPVVGSGAEWKDWATEVFDSEFAQKSECEEALIRGSSLWTELQFLRVLRKNGQLDAWTITPITRAALPRARRRELHRILNAARKAAPGVPLRVP